MKFWSVRFASILAAAAGCFVLQAALANNDGLNRLVVLALIWITLAVSLNLINGITGQFSIGHAGFWMSGAYITGTIIKFNPDLQSMNVWWLVLLTMTCSFVGTGLLGLLVGLPSLRLKGDYLAIVTLGFGEILRIIVNATESIGGSYGMFVQPTLASVIVAGMLAIVAIAVCRNLLQTAHGLEFLAVREDEVASLAMGVRTTTIKVVAFVVGAAFAGAAGAVFAHLEGFISPHSFPMAFSFMVLTMVVLGGTGSITGSVVAAVLLFAIPEYLRGVKIDGQPIAVSLAGFLAFIIMGIVGLAVAKKIQDHVHEKGKKVLISLANVVGLAIAIFVLELIFRNVPGLSRKIAVDQIRYVILALVLIGVMLLRPQGMFGHREFSWGWMKKQGDAPA